MTPAPWSARAARAGSADLPGAASTSLLDSKTGAGAGRLRSWIGNAAALYAECRLFSRLHSLGRGCVRLLSGIRDDADSDRDVLVNDPLSAAGHTVQPRADDLHIDLRVGAR